MSMERPDPNTTPILPTGYDRTALEALPRTLLATLPTPLQPARNLRAALGPNTPHIWLKRDDETGFALGGNKVRKLEMELAPGRLEGVTHLVTTGGVQSNHARVTAAAAARLGLRCTLVLNGTAPDPPRGNALLHRLFGAEIRMVPSREGREEALGSVEREVERQGGSPLVIPLGASTPTGALGYALAACELEDQLVGTDDGPREGGRVRGRVHVVVASSSCGTLAGLAAGFTLLGRPGVRLLGVSADIPRAEILARTAQLTSAILGRTDAVPPGVVDATDREVGGGYGVPTARSEHAIELFARTEGVVLDPVYTGKAAAGMIGLAGDPDAVSPHDHIVFVHTGGHPALLA